jgi:HD-like signal output (HDOD) protein/ActR/RegA family two-component response regulator
MADKKRILFVDDEPAILASLKNLLYRDRARWDMVFAPNGAEALEECHKQAFDLIVSDMRMPEIDGATLLQAVKEESPGTVRIMLSGHANREAIARALPALHQLISKPCDIKTLRPILERSLYAFDVARDVAIRRIIGGIDKLPTPPDVYFELTQLMQLSTSTVAEFAAVVARDPALSAKVLQLVNSSFFTTGQATMSIQHAVSRLGTDQLRYLALTASVFSALTPQDTCWFSLQDMQRDAARAAALAGTLAGEARDAAFAAALLQGVGHVVLALGRGPEFTAFQERAAREPRRELEYERELFGITHAEVGARLLAIWGLPPVIIDAVQFQHDPGSAPESSRQLACIVHFASASIDHVIMPEPLNVESIERAGCSQLLPKWVDAARRASAGFAGR